MRKVVSTKFPSPQVTNPVIFGAAIRAARTQSGLSIADAAMTIGVAKQTLADLERGLGTVNIELALKIAREVGVGLFAVPASHSRAVANVVLRLLLSDENTITSASAEVRQTFEGSVVSDVSARS